MTQKHAFRFGINITDFTSGDELKATARKVEDLGYSTFSTADHLSYDLAPLVSLMAVAEATTTLRVGTLVLGNDFRHPAFLAKELAALDVISNGRLEWGLGTGYAQDDYEQSGIVLDPPGVRVSRFEEAVQIIKQLFGEQPANFAGKYYTVSDLNGTPKPVQMPHPPLLIGGGSKRMLSIAGRQADIVSYNVRTTKEGQFDFLSVGAEATDQKVEWVRQAAGDRFDTLEFHALVLAVLISDEPYKAITNRLEAWGFDLGEISKTVPMETWLESPHFLVGSIAEIVEKLRARRERFGISYYTFFGEESIDLVAPILDRLAGT